VWGWLKRRFGGFFRGREHPPLPPGCWHPHRPAPEPVPPTGFVPRGAADEPADPAPPADPPRAGEAPPGPGAGGS